MYESVEHGYVHIALEIRSLGMVINVFPITYQLKKVVGYYQQLCMQ